MIEAVRYAEKVYIQLKIVFGIMISISLFVGLLFTNLSFGHIILMAEGIVAMSNALKTDIF